MAEDSAQLHQLILQQDRASKHQQRLHEATQAQLRALQGQVATLAEHVAAITQRVEQLARQMEVLNQSAGRHISRQAKRIEALEAWARAAGPRGKGRRAAPDAGAVAPPGL
jgi:hypothetical protein